MDDLLQYTPAPKKRKSKMGRNIFIMLFVIVLLVGAVIGTTQLLKRKDPKTDPRLLLTPSTAKKTDIKTVDMTLQNGTILHFYYKSMGTTNNWTIRGYEKSDFNQYRFDELLSTLTGTKATAVVNDNTSPSQLSGYGLAKPSATLLVTYQDGKQFTLYLGDQTLDKQSYYCYVKPNARLVMLIETYRARLLMRAEKSYHILPSLIVATDNLQTIDLVRGGKDRLTISAQEEGVSGIGGFILTQPYERGANLSRVTEFIKVVSTLAPNELVTDHPTDLKAYGLDHPRYIVTLKDEFGDGYTLTIGKDRNEESAYCQVKTRDDESDAVYAMMNFDLAALNITALELSEPYIKLVGIQYVDEVVIDGVQKAVMSIERTPMIEGDGTPILDNNGKPKYNMKYFLDDVQVQELAFTKCYQTIVGMMVSGATNEKVTGKSALDITFKRNGGLADLTLKFVPFGTDKLAIIDDLGQSAMYVRKEDVAAMYDTIDKLRRGKLNVE